MPCFDVPHMYTLCGVDVCAFGGGCDAGSSKAAADEEQRTPVVAVMGRHDDDDTTVDDFSPTEVDDRAAVFLPPYRLTMRVAERIIIIICGIIFLLVWQ